jgi:hypothetical protein
VGIDLPGEVTPRIDFRSQPATREESRFRHSGWAVRRDKTWEALKAAGWSDSKLDRFRECGAGLWLEWSDEAKDLRLRCNTCRDRWCLACGNERAGKVAANVATLIEARHARFVTLTRRHSAAPLRDQLDSLFACFLALRRRSWWKSHVVGGAAFLEVKISERTHAWHVHLHIVCESEYLPQRELSAEWLAVTNDSSIVDVRAVPQAGKVAAYVSKYVTKPADASVYNDRDRLIELILALRGRRLCTTFGTWRGHKLDDAEPSSVGWTAIGSLDRLLSDYREGSRDAARYLEAAARKWPALTSIIAGVGFAVHDVGPPVTF